MLLLRLLQQLGGGDLTYVFKFSKIIPHFILKYHSVLSSFDLAVSFATYFDFKSKDKLDLRSLFTSLFAHNKYRSKKFVLYTEGAVQSEWKESCHTTCIVNQCMYM